ncbi:MAG: ComEC/Rec2 family competence protein [Caulobacteraceae bacterium]|nr:ComEC/Rec2 family competence protein [Caulobacteraceae bacterium]
MRVTTGLSAGDGADIEFPDKEADPPRADDRATRRQWARGLSTRRLGLPSLGAVGAGLRDQAAAQLDRAFLWTPVAFGAGAATYLGLKTEPPALPLLIAAAAAVALALAVRRYAPSRAAAVLAGLVAAAVCGLAAAKLHSDLAAGPIAPAHAGMVEVEGWVVDVANPSESGARLLIAPVRIERLEPSRTPRLVRIVVPPEAVLGPGSAIRIRALLDPPPAPAAPGGYDFARDAWFQGIGGVGFSKAAPSVIDLAPPSWPLRWEMAVNAARWSLAQRLAADVSSLMGPRDGGATGLVVTVATSHEDWLDDQSRDDLRASGLAHMLAIAGLHTAAVSGFVFFALRLGVAAWPWLALRVPGKKLAAAGGLAAVAVYLGLSGAHPPAVRAAITASTAFLAILADRRALSLHSLAIAALAILVLQPEDVVQPGFQMSFCATAALIALAEVWPRAPAAAGLPWMLAALQRLRDWTIAMLAVSLVAGAATGPFSIQHFNRLAVYGVFANLSADFLAGAVMMPALALGAIGEGLGAGPALTAGPLFVAGWAAKAIVWLAHVFANGPHAQVAMTSAPFPALLISFVGILIACLWRGWLRVVGLPLGLAVALWPRPAAPVAWIASDGDDAAVAIAGQAVALKPGKRAYATQLWAQQTGLAQPADAAAAQAKAFTCDRKGCVPIGPARPALAAWWSTRPAPADRLAALCAHADILVTRAPVAVSDGCRAPVILGPEAFAADGAADVYAAAKGWRIVWAQPMRGRRPWSNPSGSGE